jgi:hypothetical protein
MLSSQSWSTGRSTADSDDSALDGSDEGELGDEQPPEDGLDGDEGPVVVARGGPSADLAKAISVKVIAALQGKEVGEPKSMRAPRDPCSHCGSPRHADRDCWRRLTCGTCGKKGHPTEFCYHRCKACGSVHDFGACHLEEITNLLQELVQSDPARRYPAEFGWRSG